MSFLRRHAAGGGEGEKGAGQGGARASTAAGFLGWLGGLRAPELVDEDVEEKGEEASSSHFLIPSLCVWVLPESTRPWILLGDGFQTFLLLQRAWFDSGYMWLRDALYLAVSRQLRQFMEVCGRNPHFLRLSDCARQVCLQLRAARSFSVWWPLVLVPRVQRTRKLLLFASAVGSALNVVRTAGGLKSLGRSFCRFHALKMVRTTGRFPLRVAGPVAVRSALKVVRTTEWPKFPGQCCSCFFFFLQVHMSETRGRLDSVALAGLLRSGSNEGSWAQTPGALSP